MKTNKFISPFISCVVQNFPFIEESIDGLTQYQLLCKIVEKFGDDIDRFTKTITKITDTGIKGNSITLAIQNYKQKMKQAYNRVNDAKRDYSKAVLDRINLISNAEAKSANLLDGVNNLGSISSSVNSTMNEANDIIKWVNANSEFNNVEQTPQTTNNGIKFDGASLNAWSESIK